MLACTDLISKMVYNRCKLLLVTTLLLSVSLPATSALVDRSAEAQQYSKLINSSSSNVRLSALKELSWVGLSDEALFNDVANMLQQKLDTKTLEDDPFETLLLMAALSGSGLEQYKALLVQVADVVKGKQIKAASKLAQTALERSSRLNPIKSSDKYVSGQVPFSVAVFLNFIYADELAMKRRAVSVIREDRMVNHHILDALKTDIKNNYLLENDADEWADTYLKMCDVLAYAGGAGYGPLLQQVARKAGNSDLRSGAKNLLRHYGLIQKKRL